MKKNQNNKFSMYLAVLKICRENNSVWNNLPAFAASFTDYENSIGKIEFALEMQGKNIKGVSGTKYAVIKTCIDGALLVAGALCAFASDMNDLALKARINFKKSSIKSEREIVTLQRCKLLYDEAQSRINLLGDYGVTPAVLDDFQLKINAFASYVSAPRIAIVERKGATDEISKMIARIDGILKSKMDKLIESFRATRPEFFRLYFDSRIIVDAGMHHKPSTETNPVIPS
jgi:hypothetical protein